MRKMPQEAADLVVVIQYKHQTTELKILGRNCGWRFLQGFQLQSLQNGIPGNIRGNTWATTAATKFGTLNLLRLFQRRFKAALSGAILCPRLALFQMQYKVFLVELLTEQKHLSVPVLTTSTLYTLLITMLY